MNQLLEKFDKQCNFFINKVKDTENITIGTLGPKGTSSEQALKYLIAFIEDYNPKLNTTICLMNNFIEVYNALDKRLIDYALIPTAYEKITDFFWNYNFSNNLNFIFPTPEYGLVCKNNYIPIKNRKIKIACCPAVENTIEYLSNGELKEASIEKIRTNSTTESVVRLVHGEVDLAITNYTSFDIYKDKNIKFISKTYHANIVWSLFEKN